MKTLKNAIAENYFFEAKTDYLKEKIKMYDKRYF